MIRFKSKIVVSKWYAFDVCTDCHKRLSTDEIFHGDDVCPYCGHGSSSFCDHRDVILQSTTYKPAGIFRKKTSTYKGKNIFSKQWLIDNNSNITPD